MGLASDTKTCTELFYLFTHFALHGLGKLF